MYVGKCAAQNMPSLHNCNEQYQKSYVINLNVSPRKRPFQCLFGEHKLSKQANTTWLLYNSDSVELPKLDADKTVF
jgi:hypothetical protein